MLLESLLHGDNCFVTLTYDPEHLPASQSLVPGDTQLFFKRLRHMVPPFRYFIVGEYGERTWRPHYHAVFFGLGIHHYEKIEFAWGKGHVHIGDLTPQSAAYCCSYVTKGMTNKENDKLAGRHPEFARMSLRPGIGYGALGSIAKWLVSEHGSRHLIKDKDVPTGVRFGGKIYPLGRYLRGMLRVMAGFADKGQPELIRHIDRIQKLLLTREGDYIAQKEAKRAQSRNIAKYYERQSKLKGKL